MIYLGSDHGGYVLKNRIIDMLHAWSTDFTDCGALKHDVTDDYPIYAHLVAGEVRKKPAIHVGILVCRSGIGMSIAANRHKNVRAALVWDKKLAQMARRDDLANVICLPADYLDEKTAIACVKAFLNQPMGSDKRFIRRAKEIEHIKL